MTALRLLASAQGGTIIATYALEGKNHAECPHIPSATALGNQVPSTSKPEGTRMATAGVVISFGHGQGHFDL